MKLRYLLFGLMVCTLWSCSEGDEDFNSGLTPSAFSFKPITGGAVMYYQLPNDPEVTGLYVRYNDAFGKPVTRSASTANDSLVLTGFNEAVNNVPAEVYIQRRDRSESNPIPVSFNTKDSGPVDFLKNAEVFSNWEGFTLRYSTPEYSEGLVNVFYLGIDPQTGGPDTVLISSFTIENASYDETVNFKVKQEVSKPTVIIRTEDFRGNRVGEKAFDGVEFLEQALLPPSNYKFHCAVSMIGEDDDFRHRITGPEFLFDGDLKGSSCFEKGGLATYVAGPNACGEDAEPMYIDFGESRIVASIRMYSCLYNEYSDQAFQWFGSSGQSLMMPSDVTLYAAFDDGDNTPLEEKNMDGLQWKRVSTFYQDPDMNNRLRWCPTTFPNIDFYDESNGTGWGQLHTLGELNAHEPEFFEMLVSAIGQGDGYRYLKIVVNDTFNGYSEWGFMPFNMSNNANMITFHELEVYSKKD